MTASRLVIALTILGAIPVHTQEPSASPADSTHALYGTTDIGGNIYKLDQAGNETVLYTFKNDGVDGHDPTGSLTSDPGGNLFGTTYGGGKHGKGILFKVDPSGKYTVLFNFGDTVGANPFAGVVHDSAGNLYGTTTLGGAHSFGVVFKMDSNGNETVLYSFAGDLDGIGPYAGVIRDSMNNLYGTTAAGGRHRAGVVYKVDPTGNETVLYTFTGGADGGGPYAEVTRDSSGNLFGTTDYGGKHNAGVVYKVDPAGNETVLYNFSVKRGGSTQLNSRVVRDASGNLYGTTLSGSNPNGEVYKLDVSGSYTVLHAFTGGNDGAEPHGGVVRDSAGNLYGTTHLGGANGRGVVYKIGLAGKEHVLHAFTGADGAGPLARAILR